MSINLNTLQNWSLYQQTVSENAKVLQAKTLGEDVADSRRLKSLYSQSEHLKEFVSHDQHVGTMQDDHRFSC